MSSNSGRVRVSRQRNRLFKNPRRRGRVQNPAIRRPTQLAQLAGAITVPVQRTQAKQFVWPNPPSTWLRSLGEWIVYWYLTETIHLVEGQDFYSQSKLYLDTLFSSQDFTNADFVIPMGPKYVFNRIGKWRALVFDPFTEFTHNFDFDLERMQTLDDNGYKLIFMLQDMLMVQTERIMKDGLAGQDDSNRGIAALRIG